MTLRAELHQDLEQLMVALRDYGTTTDMLSSLVPKLASLPPASIGAVERKVRSYASALPDQLNQRECVHFFPELSWVWLFHGDGYYREAALRQLPSAPLSSFFLTALFWRSNDWVAQVRDAAERRLEVEVTSVSPAVALEVALHVLFRLADWNRLSLQTVGFLETLLKRSDVCDVLIRRLMEGGKESRTAHMEACLRFDILDAHLYELATQSASAPIRRLALRVLMQGYAEVPNLPHAAQTDGLNGGLYGKYNLAWNNEHRRVPAYDNLSSLIRACLIDKSAMVRRIAADALIINRGSFHDVDALAHVLLTDRNASIRERGVYLLRTDSKNQPRKDITT